MWWVDESWLALATYDTLHLVSRDGVLVNAGAIGWEGVGVEIANGHALIHDRGMLRLGDLTSGEWTVLGTVGYGTFTPDGNKVVWLSRGGRLSAFDLATGTTESLASRVRAFVLVEAGVIAFVPDVLTWDDTVLFLPW